MRLIVDYGLGLRQYPLYCWHKPISVVIGLLNESVNELNQSLISKKEYLDEYMLYPPSAEDIEEDDEYFENESIYNLFDDFIQMELNYQITILYHYFENTLKAHHKLITKYIHRERNLNGFIDTASNNVKKRDECIKAIIKDYKDKDINIDIRQMTEYKAIDELRLLTNCIKHNDSKASNLLAGSPYGYKAKQLIEISVEQYQDFSNSIISFFDKLNGESKLFYGKTVH